MNPADVGASIAHADPLVVAALEDPLVEAHGHAPDSLYVETYWLPIIGPSALWALRRLTRSLEVAPEGFPVALAPLARELGLGEGTSPSSPVVRTLARIVRFNLANLDGDRLLVRRTIQPLAARQLRHLPPHLAAQHPSIALAGPSTLASTEPCKGVA